MQRKTLLHSRQDGQYKYRKENIMGNEKMNNLPGTPGWIAANMGGKKSAETENKNDGLDKKAGLAKFIESKKK